MTKIAQPPGIEVVLAFDGTDAALLRLAARATDGDYVAFARRAVLDAARAIAGLVPPHWFRGAPGDARAGAGSAQYEAAAPKGMSIAEAAEHYGVKHDRLQRAARDGRLRARKLGSRDKDPWDVQAIEVERFLATSRRGPKRRTGS